MFGEHFYHKKIRNTVIAFGTIFNNVNIKRLDSSGNPLQNIKIPLSYSPKEKFLARLDNIPSKIGLISMVVIFWPIMSTGSLLKNWHGIETFMIIGLSLVMTKKFIIYKN